jgi:N-acetylglucosamine-6-phosphate deacetylase
MNKGTLIARDYSHGGPIHIEWRDGLFTRIEADQRSLPPEVWIAPPLLDVQVNGFGGVDFQQDNLSSADLLRAIRALRATGCARACVTLITDDWPRLLDRLKHLCELRASNSELISAIAGWHLEGPFLSAEPGYHGAHPPELMRDPSPAHLEQLRGAAGGEPILLTLAPEREGAIDAISTATTLGIRVSLGHTNASSECLARAVQAGARGFTHLGNACPQTLDRHDNILWRVLETPGLQISVIPDSIHVSPALFRILHRLDRSDSLLYTTDAMAAAGAFPGRYSIGRLELEVGPDRIVRQPGRTNFAGSALTPIDGIKRAAQMLHERWQSVWDRFSLNPARLMGFPHPMQVGQPASFCVINTSERNDIQSMRLCQDGEWLENESDNAIS